MAGLWSAIVLKYIVYMSKKVTYPELIAKICCHIEDEKTSNLKASKLSQDILFGGKYNLDTKMNTPKQDGHGNEMERETRMEIMEAIITT